MVISRVMYAMQPVSPIGYLVAAVHCHFNGGFMACDEKESRRWFQLAGQVGNGHP